MILGGLVGAAAVVGLLSLRSHASSASTVWEEPGTGHRALRCAGAGVLFLLGVLAGLAFAWLLGTTPR